MAGKKRSGRIKYSEISKAKIKPSRNLVISSCNRGGYTLAQQLEVDEEGRQTSVFLSHAIIVDDVQGLINLRDAINVALDKIQNTQNAEEEDDWDA